MKSNNPISIRVISSVLIAVLLCSISFGQRKPTVDSLLFDYYIDFAIDQHDTIIAQAYLDSAKVLMNTKDLPRNKIDYLNAQSTMLFRRGKNKEIVDILTQGLHEYGEDLKPSELIAIYSNIGLAYYGLGEADKSVIWHLKTVELAEASNNKMGLARGYNNLGICYQKVKDWWKALTYHKKSLAICLEENILPGKAFNYGNLGIIYNNLANYDSALLSHQKSLEFNRQMNERYQEAINLNNIAVVYESLKLYDSALSNHRKSLKIRELLGEKVGIVSSLNNIAALQITLGKGTPQAKQFLLKALEIATEIEAKDLLRETHFNLSQLYETKRDFYSALEHRKLYEIWKDSTISEGHLNRISELELKYESQKKENEILELSQANLVKQVRLEQHTAIIEILVIGLIIFVILTTLMIIIFKQRALSRNQKHLLKTITDTQEKERSRIARDLHDSVGIMLTAIKHKTETSASNSEIKQMVDESIAEVRRISHNMMPGALLKYGLKSTLEQLVSHVRNSEKINATFYSYGLEERLHTNLEITLYRIIQELSQNVIKHANASLMSLHINRHEDHVNIILEDNGIGFKNENTITGEGMGLQNIKSRIKAWNGEMVIDSKETGTIVLINVPISND